MVQYQYNNLNIGFKMQDLSNIDDFERRINLIIEINNLNQAAAIELFLRQLITSNIQNQIEQIINTQLIIRNEINDLINYLNLRQFTQTSTSNLNRASPERQPSPNAFFQALERSMRENYRHVEVTTPSDGENAKRAALLPEDVDIPEEFICPLSQAIMTDPVFDPESGNRFERAWILAEIQRTGKNPCNRQDLSKESLKPDSKLQEEINQFLITHEQANKPRVQ